MSILLGLELSLAQLLLATYFKSILDLEIKLHGFFFPVIKLPGFFPPVILGIKLPGLLFPDLILDLYKCQHSSSLVSSIKKRIFVIFEKVPLFQPGFESRTFGIGCERLIHYSIEKVMLRGAQKDNLYTQQSLRDRPKAQGHILSRLAFLKYL